MIIARSMKWNETYSSFNNQQTLSQNPTSIYEQILHDLRIVMIDHMAKPEEVIIVEDENGEIVREMTQDTAVIAQYNTMRETLVYLTNLNNEDIQTIMLDKLDLQVTMGQFTWNGESSLFYIVLY